MVRIAEILPDSIAEELRLRIGSRIVRINGEPVRNSIDFRFMEADGELEIEVSQPDGSGRVVYEIEKPAGESLGVSPLPFVIAVMVGALVFLWRVKDRLAPGLFPWVAASIVLSIAAEFAFTRYVSVFGAANAAGHWFKFVAFFALYMALVVRTAAVRQTLAESEARLRLIAENVDDVVWLSAPDFSRFNYVSPAYEGIFGLPVEQLDADPMSWLAVVHEDDRERVRRFIQGDPTQERRSAFRVVRPGGEVRHLAARAYPVVDESGRVTATAGVLSDVTEDVEQARRERGLERELFQLRKTEALGTVAGGIAHDLNNLLLPILSLSDMAVRHMAEDDANRRRLEKVIEAAGRARDLVRRVVAFNREEDAAAPRQDLASAVADGVEMLRLTLPSTIDVEADIEPLDRAVTVNRNVMVAVLLNLGSNAADAMELGTGHIRVDLRERILDGDEARRRGLGAGAYAVLTVTDDGAGMDTRTLARAFEPFFTTKLVGSGSGLGLSSVFSTARELGGAVWADSTRGKGTTVTLALPAANNDVSPSAADAPPSSPGA